MIPLAIRHPHNTKIDRKKFVSNFVNTDPHISPQQRSKKNKKDVLTSSVGPVQYKFLLSVYLYVYIYVLSGKAIYIYIHTYIHTNILPINVCVYIYW